MTTVTAFSLAVLILAAAFLYASVGQAGASGYLAAMALFGVTPEVMKPTALVLNILVATIATMKYYRAGYFSWSTLWPFAIASIPFSFIGGGLSLPANLYKPFVGLILLYAAYRFFRFSARKDQDQQKPIPLWGAFVSGAMIGLLSGLTGTGGGIFLSPLLIFMGWAELRQSSGVSAAFILVNSLAGLFGHLASLGSLPALIPFWAIAAMIGGYVGAEYGSKRLNNMVLKRLLGVVLVIAGLKMIFA